MRSTRNITLYHVWIELATAVEFNCETPPEHKVDGVAVTDTGNAATGLTDTVTDVLVFETQPEPIGVIIT